MRIPSGNFDVLDLSDCYTDVHGLPLRFLCPKVTTFSGRRFFSHLSRSLFLPDTLLSVSDGSAVSRGFLNDTAVVSTAHASVIPSVCGEDVSLRESWKPLLDNKGTVGRAWGADFFLAEGLDSRGRGGLSRYNKDRESVRDSINYACTKHPST